jgi:hypothetical protein
VQRHKAKLYNITDATDVISGSSEYTNLDLTTYSVIKGIFTITATKTFEIQHRCQVSKSINGLGIDSNFGINEVYTEVELWRLY